MEWHLHPFQEVSGSVIREELYMHGTPVLTLLLQLGCLTLWDSVGVPCTIHKVNDHVTQQDSVCSHDHLHVWLCLKGDNLTQSHISLWGLSGTPRTLKTQDSIGGGRGIMMGNTCTTRSNVLLTLASRNYSPRSYSSFDKHVRTIWCSEVWLMWHKGKRRWKLSLWMSWSQIITCARFSSYYPT